MSFEAAARNVSFKAAAKELNVTPAAVSHQIKALEREMNCSLFHRFHRGVELTESGAYLLVALQRGFEEINEAVSQLRSQHGRSAVTIRSTTAVSSLWLTPRLAQFWKSHGHISVAQVVSDHGAGVPDCDLSIHYGNIDQETGNCRVLFHDEIMALGSPRFADEHNLKTVEDLAHVPLIHLEAPDTGWTNWHEWARALGYHGELKTAHRVNNYIIALQAARDDMGAVLGWEGLTSDLIDAGKLVKLIPETVSAPLDFYVKLHNQSSQRANIVFEWLTQFSD
ncbi:LysR substrate-binding domain-containing protein [Aliiroseovarius sp. KMU-50]|uniref:LysR substrate-binding domain-containing protein n=1 Tax=Aliiroseovarius salicola TaxID=3009082 RepID=A0ABT4W4Z5_9RHOB|nr:LysR substrate-binding domain-containing protein [Aliiroseovarius sp. KMU-50]MDA5095541.1 LysR substrate-binding domain-containing protein [Aliiroseovarius sp. KMU-50]